MFIHFYWVYLRHFLNHPAVFLVLFWNPLWPSVLGSRLVRRMVAPVGGGAGELLGVRRNFARIAQTCLKHFCTPYIPWRPKKDWRERKVFISSVAIFCLIGRRFLSQIGHHFFGDKNWNTDHFIQSNVKLSKDLCSHFLGFSLHFLVFCLDFRQVKILEARL